MERRENRSGQNELTCQAGRAAQAQTDTLKQVHEQHNVNSLNFGASLNCPPVEMAMWCDMISLLLAEYNGNSAIPSCLELLRQAPGRPESYNSRAWRPQMLLEATERRVLMRLLLRSSIKMDMQTELTGFSKNNDATQISLSGMFDARKCVSAWELVLVSRPFCR